ncbi:MAG TPA: GNAT family N-acetyltransferase [Roseiflexaceae bacterium]|nr:GNAT family N-acetyltransferase [Roseiflexaceae bacterium]
MAPDDLEIIALRAEDMAALEAVLDPALHFPAGTTRNWVEALGIENFRAGLHAGRVVAGLCLVRMGQWFGGARVSMVGLSAVGVAPDRRGSGVGTALLCRTLEELHGEGIPLAALYPSSLRFYRRAGFERAGQRITYELALAAIDVEDRSLTLAPFEASQYEAAHRIYEQRARRSSGNLDRPAWVWQNRVERKDAQLFRFLVKNGESAEGYVVFFQGGRFDPLTVTDLCVLTPGAGRRVLGLFAGYRSTVEHVTWSGGPLDPLLYLLGAQLTAGARNTVKVTRALDWVLRIVDVPGALAARGYPPGLSAELHFDVRDDLLPANAGRFVLRVADGRGEVVRGGAGRIQLHVRDLAAIYTSFMAPHECAYLGTIEAPENDLALAAAVFAGPRPWIADMF